MKDYRHRYASLLQPMPIKVFRPERQSSDVDDEPASFPRGKYVVNPLDGKVDRLRVGGVEVWNAQDGVTIYKRRIPLSIIV